MTFKIKWLDGHRNPQCPANPAFPNGMDIDASHGLEPACKVDLPYPAVRCGKYLVSCNQCGANAMATTAGRADDPRSVKFPCKIQSH
jgi:hypothetical protein